MHIDVHGHAVHCQSGGRPFDPARPTVVLVHGALNDHSVFDAQAQTLADAGFAVLAPDLPGHGASVGPALASVDALADWLLALLDAAGVRRALLAGHSMGSLVALAAAAQAPERAAGLALLGATWPMRVSAALLATARDDEPAAIEMVAGWSHASAATRPAIIDAARTLMQRIAARNPGQLLYTDLNACNAWADGETAARNLGCPVLFIQGQHDRMTPPRTAAILTGAVADATIVEVDAGHAMMAEAADAVSCSLRDFAARVFSG